MSYQVIARKYRPQRFSDVVGQEHVTQTLTHALEQNRIAHAYLFCGPRGTGKTTIARIFAKCLNCAGGPKVDFDDDDPRVQEITEGRSIDVLEIDGASNRGIDEIRELRETVKYAPATSRFKIYIVDEVHMLTKEAFNALLKTLEEPPAHVKFMFATTEPEKVLPTILSRCQRFDLRRIPVALIVEHLTKIARKEKVKIDSAALHAIARGADGGMRDAESALDQLISFCGDKIVESDVLSMFGLTAQGQILSLAGALLRDEAETVLKELNDLAKHGKDLGRFLSDLLAHFRNLLVYQVSRGDLKMLEISETEKTVLVEQTATVTSDALTRVMEVLTEAEGRLRDAASKKIFVEVTLLKAMQARRAVSVDTLLSQLQQLRAGEGAGASAPAVAAKSASPAAGRSAEAPRSPATPTASESTLPGPITATAAPADLENLWRQLLEAVGRTSAFTRSYLVEARPVSLANNVLTIGFDPEFADQLELVDNAKNHTLLQTKLKELGHPGTQIKFVKAEASPRPAEDARPTEATPPVKPAPSAAAPAAPATRKAKAEPASVGVEEFKNDPLIKQALEIFKGQIVEVRA
jgi:DNA polymerase-3 subunit gamma/tau